MPLSIKQAFPHFLKSIFWKLVLRYKFSGTNKIGRKVTFSKDLVLGNHCVIGDNVSLGEKVKIGNQVKVGKDAVIEKTEIGDFTCIESGVIITGDGQGKIKIGKHCYIGIYNVLDHSDNITIGDFVHIAGTSTGLWTHTSAKMCLEGVPINEKNELVRPTAPICIEDNIYIGGNCTLYPGITIGHHSIIAPNSAVNKDVPPNTLFGGVPAKFIKNIH